ncbi:MAG: tRNA (uridine(34)/cytosine(34)/5-carboxymethylaminomethyluridine(34)-2'-O)-methyltransferase TrmL [Nitrospinaceae bacterium]|nr:tRNA (cytidine(34)-2'-O)-methyltransferase [Nitrospinaceae bacterium]NIR53352.1 tRNA (cytidine(34)-2'-O)-methyltransferase [Nitrospinaceae bacterium]NIS83752.1 tRNA (cytidine(34)-2'-O)-methyltransferase [Nitrospinaceae bacterium]NIT80551.1 tRNA (cytidine(34)-2'-O)-methyltransferase [Nitrospinaceae bacterium]NIU42876.1 tRNA (cytidine(34)-2'-O)-methyltransferase [Nitrospinaceae bacterium]
MPHHLHIVLVEPQIPVNTGSIGRLCLATQCTLHLVEPLGFEITDSKLKRAGLDYWKHVDLVVHPNLEAFFASVPEAAPRIFFSKKAPRSYFEHRFEEGSYLVFGNEINGLDEEVLQRNASRTFSIPQYDDRVRSLNLANAVSVVVYEAIRQLGP